MTPYLFLLTGIAIGTITAWLLAKSRFQDSGGISTDQFNESEQERRVWEEKAAFFQKQMDEQKKEITARIEEIKRLTGENSQWQEKHKALDQKLSEQKKELEDLQNKFAKEFENLANRIFDDKSKKFTDQNKTNLDIILNPLKEKIKEFEQKVENTYKAESAERIILKTEIKNLVELNKQVSEEANNLAKALKGDSKMQGNWGEVILEKILERSGLVKEQEYKTQVSTADEEGRKALPDVIIYLPDNKHIIIDSKVSLLAYERAVNAKTDEEREPFIKEHIASVRNHIRMLGDKEYQHLPGVVSPDFVLLFMPIEASFGFAVQADQELFSYAWDRKIVIVSPSTLLATLRTVSSLWKQEKQTRNVLEIAEQSGKLHDKFVAFVEDLIRIGKRIDEAKGEYAEAMKKLYEGTGNLVKRAEDIKKLGAKTTKSLPQQLVDRANEEV